MEIELAANLVGLAISVFIGRFAYAGYAAVGSPNLLRLTIAFISISAGFVMLASALFAGPGLSVAINTAGLTAQAVGYFFIAMSHGLKSSFDFLPSKRGTALLFIPFTTAPFIIPGNSIEHLVRSISFILLVYVSIETMASYMQTRKSSTLMIGSGLGTLAAAEIVAWYGFIFPGAFALPALLAKVAGFGLMVVPFSRLGLGRVEKVDGV
ncbi:MAG: hypothetical protein QXJ74_10580 [Nitrososphaera sp.]|uniref:hypothetical protein n=1 Tax=Nitrososphaera sp. TaxID=1971748 RepID=UPI0017F82E33|nr:hypothetical protein [Nitrososphaera sp.]NWG36317.1 hypothetical protein [Nitrososphaera sp.]